MGKSGFSGKLFNALLPVVSCLIAAFIAVQPVYAYQTEFAGCGLGQAYSGYAQALAVRQAQLLNLAALQAKRLPGLYERLGSANKWSAVITASELSAVALATNFLVFGAIGGTAAGAGAAAEGAEGGEAVASELAAGQKVETALTDWRVGQKAMTLRQFINASIGTIGTSWAATNGSVTTTEYGQFPMPPNIQLASDMSDTDTHTIDGYYNLARKKLHDIDATYANVDMDISRTQVTQYKMHIDLHGYTSYAKQHHVVFCKDYDPMGGGIQIPCNEDAWVMTWHLVKFAWPWSNPEHEKAVSLGIQVAAAKAHITNYLNELSFIDKELGRLQARCEEKFVHQAGSEAMADKADELWDGLYSQDKQLYEQITGQHLSGRAPSEAGGVK